MSVEQVTNAYTHLFEEAGRCPVRLEVRGIDHQGLGLAGPASKPGEDAVEHAQTAPSHEAVVQGLMGTVGRRGVAPAQPIADDVEDAADHPLVVHPRHPVREREVGRDPPDLRPR